MYIQYVYILRYRPEVSDYCRQPNELYISGKLCVLQIIFNKITYRHSSNLSIWLNNYDRKRITTQS